MFRQKEKDENDPEMELEVHYCDEHKEEGKKSPYLCTEEDYKRKRQREEDKKVQEEKGREEKLNNQKNLFFLDGLVDSKSEGKSVRRHGDYGAFWVDKMDKIII